MEKEQRYKLVDLATYQENGIVSTRIHENKSGGITVFAFDQGQRLSEHSAPFDAIVTVLEGNGEIVIGGKPHKLTVGEVINMPANTPHAINAVEKFKMMLVMIRG
jgi:quercetin dioxygenase-like cupin family protein